MLSMVQCLIIYLVVCGLLSLVCLILFDEVPWPGYILTMFPLAAVVCYHEGFMTAFLVLAIINCLTMIPYIFATLVNFIKLVIPAAAEIVFTVIQADPLWQRILLGISLCCVFFAANFVFVLYEVKNDLNHLH